MIGLLMMQHIAEPSHVDRFAAVWADIEMLRFIARLASEPLPPTGIQLVEG